MEANYKLEWVETEMSFTPNRENGLIFNRDHLYAGYYFTDKNLIQVTFDFRDISYNIQTPGQNTYTTSHEKEIVTHTMTSSEEAECLQAAKNFVTPDDILKPMYKGIAASYLKATEPLTGFMSNRLTPEEQTESQAYRNLQYDIIQDPLGIPQPDPLTDVMKSALTKFGLEHLIPLTW